LIVEIPREMDAPSAQHGGQPTSPPLVKSA
jgi:hypothetical protein